MKTQTNGICEFMTPSSSGLARSYPHPPFVTIIGKRESSVKNKNGNHRDYFQQRGFTRHIYATIEVAPPRTVNA